MTASAPALYGSDPALLTPLAARLLKKGWLKWAIALSALAASSSSPHTTRSRSRLISWPMPKRTTALKNLTVDRSAFDDILGVLIATPPIRQAKPKRKPVKKQAKSQK